MDRTVSLGRKQLYTTRCSQHVHFCDTLCFPRSTPFLGKIRKEFSFHIGKVRVLLYDCSSPSILREHKHIKHLYIPPIYREITLGTGKQTLYRWGGYGEMPSVCWLATAMSAQHCASCQNGMLCWMSPCVSRFKTVLFAPVEQSSHRQRDLQGQPPSVLSQCSLRCTADSLS